MAKRRSDNEGTIRKRDNGRWEARFVAGHDPLTGKAIRKSIYGYTKNEVREKLQEACGAVSTGEYVDASKMPLGDWMDIWLSEYTLNVKEHTKVIYETQVRVHIKPALGRIPLCELRVHQIQTFYNQLHRGSAKKKALSPKTIKNAHGILHRALDQAVLIGYLKDNPTKGVMLPRVGRAPMRPLMDDEVGRFLTAIKGNAYEALFTVDMFTGMRQSEIMGLTWDCVNFRAGTILIDKQLMHEKKKGGIYKFASLKNDRPRKITPPPTVMEILQDIQRQQKVNKLKAGGLWKNELNLVFTNDLGGHLTHNTLSHNYKRIAVGIGVPESRFHDLRHTYAVTALQSGVDIKTVQEALGHHTAAFTLDIYGHVTEQMKNEAASRMDAFMKAVRSDS